MEKTHSEMCTIAATMEVTIERETIKEMHSQSWLNLEDVL